MEDIKNNYPSIKGVNWDSMIKMDFVQIKRRISFSDFFLYK